jgi:hypothetical protein
MLETEPVAIAAGGTNASISNRVRESYMNQRGGQASPSARLRDYRIDFVRGLALIMILINHIPGNVVGYFTSRNFGYSDSAEAFVLLAGYAAAFAYYPRFAGGYPIATSVRVWRRAGLLYTAHILSSVLALALFASATILLANTEFVRMVNIPPIIEDPIRGFLGLATLGHQLSFFNILPLYIVLLSALPLLMILHRRDWRALLVVSFLIYLVTGFWRIRLPSFPSEATWFFNPLSWQFLFVIGFVWGARIRLGLAIPYSRVVFWSACAYAVVALVWVQMPALWPHFPESDVVGALWGFSKTFESPIRLLHVLALAYVIGMSPLARWMRHIPASNVVVQMGQHALPNFCVGSVLSMALQIARVHLGGSLWLDVASALLGLLILVLLTRFLVWQSNSAAGQVGSVAASGFVAGQPAVTPPPVPPDSAIART